MRIRSAICGLLVIVLLCAPFEAGVGETTLTLPSGLKVINSLAYAGLKKDLVVFPSSIYYIADDAFIDAQFTGTGETGSYAYYWCIEHGFPWKGVGVATPTPRPGTTAKPVTAQTLKEVNYAGRTIWQRYVQRHFLKATVNNVNHLTEETTFPATACKYNIRCTLYYDEIYDQANFQTKLNSIEVMLKGWDGDDEEDNDIESFEKDIGKVLTKPSEAGSSSVQKEVDRYSTEYTTVYKADWVAGKAYNVKELMYDEWGNVAQYYDETTQTMKDHYNHLDKRPDCWEGAFITIDTGNNTVTIGHPGELSKDSKTYVMNKANYCTVTTSTKNLIVNPKTNQPYKKLRVKVTANFNNTGRIAFHESTIDNIFVNVVQTK